jgi:hypothetical protein
MPGRCALAPNAIGGSPVATTIPPFIAKNFLMSLCRKMSI